MSNERIDLTRFEIEMEWELSELADCIPDLVAELKRTYEKIDRLMLAYKELGILKRKIELLDVVHDEGNALDHEILSSDILRREELAGLYDASVLEQYVKRHGGYHQDYKTSE